MYRFLVIFFALSFFQIAGQINIVPNPGFESHSTCPNFGGQWNYCTSWDNVNLNLGPGLWGTPDYFHTCGSGTAVPPNTFAGTCFPQAGNAMMALVMYNVPYPDYREYLSSQLTCAMEPGNTYTLSFWLSNGTVIKSPWTIKNIGVHFSNGPLTQSGYAVINVVPQCEITTNVISNVWTQYTFTVSPTATWNYITIGCFRTDALNNPTQSFPNPGGPASVYANYFLDEVNVMAPASLSPTVVASGPSTICAGTSATLTATGATSFTWNPGNITGSSIVVNPASTTNYTVTGSNSSCSTATTTLALTVVPNPTITTLASPSTICPGGTSNLLAAGALTFTWQPGNLNTALITVTPAISTIYTVSGANAAGCVSGSTVLVAVSPNPTITINPASPTVCQGSAVTLTANGALTYTWMPGGNTTSAITVTPAINTTYTVTGNNAFCSGSNTVLLTVNPTPTVIAATTTPSICIGSSATLSAIGATTYTWNPGNLVGATVVVSPLGITVYTVTGTTGLCTDTKTVLVVVDTGPAVTISSSPTTICSASGASATLTANGAFSYTWNPGAVISSSLVITPTVTSTYSVLGSNIFGCISTTTVSYSVTPTPTLIAASSSTAICVGKTVTLSASGAASYTWNPGSLSGGTITASPSANTVYTVTGTNGICTSSATLSIIVNANPTVTASSSPTLICNGSSSTLTASGALTYTWSPGSLTGATVSVAPSTTTNYTVVGTNASGCTATAVTNVSVNVTTTVNVIATPTAVCVGGTSTLTASGATSYTWNPGNIVSPTIAVSPATSTTYTVVGLSGICLGSQTITLIVNPLPVITITSSPSSICLGNSTTLTASGASTYSWSPIAVTGNSVVVSPTINTIYTVTGTNSLGCVNTKTVAITVNANPTVTAAASQTNICSGTGLSSILSATGANTFTWNPGNLSGPSVTVVPVATTVYTVTGTNVPGCKSSQTVSIFITPTPTLTSSPATISICQGNSATLSINGATNYTWMPGNSTATTIIVSPTVTSVYSVVGANGNCISNKTFTVFVVPGPTVNVTALLPVICSGGSSLLQANGALSYSWNPGSSNSNTLLVTPSVTTTYTVTGINISGCTYTTPVTVTVNPGPALIVTSSSSLICSGNTASLSFSGGVNYITNPGAQTGSLIVVSPTVSTTYTITALNSLGCTDTKTITIGLSQSPTITAASSGTLLCDGGTFSLTANGAVNYTWMPVALTGSAIVTTATTSIQNYTVIGEVGGCKNTTTVSVLVISCNNTMFGMTKAAGKPKLVYNSFYDVSFTVTAVNASTINLTNVTLNEDLSTAFPMPSNYTVVSQPVITSQNSSLTVNPLFDGGSQISLTSPATSTLLASKRDTIVFTVRIDPKGYFGPFRNWVIGFADFINNVTVADSSNDGFTWDPDHDGDPTNNDTVTIINLPVIDLFIPDAFSPDGDGKNDLFFVKGLNGRSIKLTVFNRWGNKVYERSEYDNSWNAYPNVAGLIIGNNKVPPATYYYIIEFLDGDKETRTGFVVVQY